MIFLDLIHYAEVIAWFPLKDELRRSPSPA